MDDVNTAITAPVLREVADPLAFLVQRIVDLADPRQIILFGSAARNTAGPQSDIDLLVVMPEGTHRRETARRLYQLLTGVGVPFDLVVATERDLDEHRNNPGLIYSTALKEGRVVYAG